MKLRAIKVMLLPNNWQRTRLFQYAGIARFAYNWALDKEMKSLKNGKGLISDGELRKEFTLLKKQKEFFWLNTVSNDVPKQAIKDLVKAYLRYFKLKKQPNYVPYTKKQIAHAKRVGKSLTEYDKQGHPKFKKKKDVQKYSFFNDTHKLVVIENAVRITSLYTNGNRKRCTKKSFVKLAEKNRIPINCKYNNPRITYDGIHWWISVVVEIEKTNLSINTTKTQGIGIDMGVKDLAIDSNGIKYANINKTQTVRKLEKKKRRLQRQISRKYGMNKKGECYQKTKNIEKSEKKLLKIEHRLNGIKNNYRQQTTTTIINSNPEFICIENLNISGMIKNRHLSKAVQNQGLYDMRKLIEYKANDSNIPVIIADRWFPSSKTCNCCGKIKKILKLSDRTYKCDCGYIEDRDINAAKNLRDYGKLVLASSM